MVFSSFVSRRMLPDFAHLLLAESFHTTNYFCFFHLHLYTLVSSRLRKHTLLSRWLHTTLRMTVIISLVLSPICWKLWCCFFFLWWKPICYLWTEGSKKECKQHTLFLLLYINFHTPRNSLCYSVVLFCQVLAKLLSVAHIY